MDTETSRVGKLLADQAEEIVKLKQQNAELLVEMEIIADAFDEIERLRQKVKELEDENDKLKDSEIDWG